jgi:uncharacterized protein (TIGR02996 family)
LHADEIPFLNAIFQSPNEDVPRLIYADWLEERGDQRSAFLRLEVELSHPKSKRKRRDLERTMHQEFRFINQWWRQLIVDIRYKNLDVVQEFFWLGDGMGLLEIIGDARESALLLEGKPVAFNWSDSAGGYSQFLVVTVRKDLQQLVPQMKDLTGGKLDGQRSLGEQLRPLLSVFSSGLYKFVFTPSQVVKDWAQVVVNKDMQNYLPFPRNLVCTQPYAFVAWDEAYRGGNQTIRPTVVTTSVTNAICEFVIAGH